MADRGHHGESQHDERDVAVPSMPGAGLVMIKAKLVFCRLETVFDGPAAAFHAHKLFDGNKGKRHSRGDSPFNHGDGESRLGCKGYVIVSERLKRIAAHDVAQVIGFPPAAAQYGLLPPRARNARRLRPHPARLAPLIAKQAVQECSCRSRNPLLRKQRAYPLLHIPQRRCPKLKRCFNRRSRHPCPPNHLGTWFREITKKDNCNDRISPVAVGSPMAMTSAPAS